jgi:hypothetical protein
MKASRTVVGDDDEYPEDPWAALPERRNKLGLAKTLRERQDGQSDPSSEGKKEEAVMKVLWPDYIWQQDAADFTVTRGFEYQSHRQPFGEDFTLALHWYWSHLEWRDDAASQASDKGVSWKELAIDFWCATGVIARFPRHKRVNTTLQHMAEAFASASRALHEEEAEHGGWVWRGRCGRTSSLAPFGQKAAVTGLSVRPRLRHGTDVGFVLCRLATAAAKGGKEEEVEEWRRRHPPSWRRWKREEKGPSVSEEGEATGHV